MLNILAFFRSYLILNILNCFNCQLDIHNYINLLFFLVNFDCT